MAANGCDIGINASFDVIWMRLAEYAREREYLAMCSSLCAVQFDNQRKSPSAQATFLGSD
jgi:hypothetical protein